MADRFLQTTPAVTPARTPRQHTAFVRIKSGLAALRDFKPAYVGSGSIATDEVEVTRSRMSASPLKADNLHTISASPLSANNRREQMQQKTITRSPRRHATKAT